MTFPSSLLYSLASLDNKNEKQLWNVIIPLVCTEVINEMIILAIQIIDQWLKFQPTQIDK